MKHERTPMPHPYQHRWSTVTHKGTGMPMDVCRCGVIRPLNIDASDDSAICNSAVADAVLAGEGLP